MPTTPTPALLAVMLEQFDTKHDAAHDRLRDAIDVVQADVAALRKDQTEDRGELNKLKWGRERRKELSMNKTVIISATIAAGARLMEVFLTHVFALLEAAK